MSTFFRGITETIPSLFRGISSEQNSVANPTQTHENFLGDNIVYNFFSSNIDFWMNLLEKAKTVTGVPKNNMGNGSIETMHEAELKKPLLMRNFLYSSKIRTSLVRH